MGDSQTVKAYAKIVGPGWVHYMLKPVCILGRGPASVDIVIGKDVSISRQHVKISFSPDMQGFEISVIGKNGIFVNGDFLRQGEQPRLLRSHTDIIIGRSQPSLITFYLPRHEPTKNSDDDAPSPTKSGPSMVSMVGQLLITSPKPLNSCQIYEKLVKTRVRLLENLGSRSAIESSIRSAITGNPHIFEIIPAFDMQKRDEIVGEPSKPHTLAGFTVKKNHRLRFLQASTKEAETNGKRSTSNGPGTGNHSRNVRRRLIESD